MRQPNWLQAPKLFLHNAAGKTNRNEALFGRTMRHKQVETRSVGALDARLFFRFFISKELAKFDFTNDRKWFFVKRVADHRSSFKCDERRMGEQFCNDQMKTLARQLNTNLPGALHFGREAGSVLMESR